MSRWYPVLKSFLDPLQTSSPVSVSMMDSSINSMIPNPDPCLNVEITPELIAQHGLLPEEYENILEILGRTPNLTELGIFSVMWSEHCAYKNTRKLLKLFSYRKEGQGCRSAKF